MKKIFLAGLILLPIGCAAFDPMVVREEKYGKEVPVIHQHFASQSMRPGDTWKVYLNASDANGDMKDIVCIIETSSAGSSLASHTRIKEEDRMNLSGYIYWKSPPGLNFSNIKLTMQIRDMAEHFSESVSFTLTSGQDLRQEDPPPKTFQGKNLGRIMVTIMADPLFGYPTISY